MFLPFSIVVITKNEELNIAKTLQSVKNLSNNIVVIDSGSTDNTVKIATGFGAQVVQSQWLGYGTTKNLGNATASHDWILSLDADEEVDEKLFTALQKVDYTNPNIVYSIKRNTVFNGKKINFGVCLTERKIRLFNKKNVCWNTDAVHEELVIDIQKSTVLPLQGCILHYSFQSKNDALQRMDKYAKLYASQQNNAHKKANPFIYFSKSIFDFCKNYFFRLGFLDGKAGWWVCYFQAFYVFNKYRYLFEQRNRE